MKRVFKFDIIISGAGVAGLWLAKKLSEPRYGYSVAVFERAQFLAGFASTRNEGWLHCGTYHGGAIPVRDIAVRVATQTLDGYQQTMKFAQDAIIEDRESKTFALVKDLDVAEIEDRWSVVGVPFERISKHHFSTAVPEVRTDGVSAFYSVKDVSINNCALYKKLRDTAEVQGVQILTNSEIVSLDGMRASVRTPSGSELYEAKQYVHTTGFGIRDFFRKHFDQDLPLRLWKSHLIDLPRVAKHGAFFLDPGEATLMHHVLPGGTEFTIAGFNSDSTAVEEPNFDPITENIEDAKAALERMLYNVDFRDAEYRACIKVDQDRFDDDDKFVPEDGDPYTRPKLSVTFEQPVPGHMYALSGKMTEGPFVADRVIDKIRDQVAPSGTPRIPTQLSHYAQVAKRPIDKRD